MIYGTCHFCGHVGDLSTPIGGKVYCTECSAARQVLAKVSFGPTGAVHQDGPYLMADFQEPDRIEHQVGPQTHAVDLNRLWRLLDEVGLHPWIQGHEAHNPHLFADSIVIDKVGGTQSILTKLPDTVNNRFVLAAYIAEVNPQTLVVLLREITRLRDQVERLRGSCDGEPL